MVNFLDVAKAFSLRGISVGWRRLIESFLWEGSGADKLYLSLYRLLLDPEWPETGKVNGFLRFLGSLSFSSEIEGAIQSTPSWLACVGVVLMAFAWTAADKTVVGTDGRAAHCSHFLPRGTAKRQSHANPHTLLSIAPAFQALPFPYFCKLGDVCQSNLHPVSGFLNPHKCFFATDCPFSQEQSIMKRLFFTQARKKECLSTKQVALKALDE